MTVQSQPYTENLWFRQLPQELQEDIKAIIHFRSFNDGDFIVRRGDEAKALYYVTAGSIRVSAVTASGDETSLTYLQPGSWFGEISFFDGRPRTHDANAFGKTELCLLPFAQLHELSLQHPELMRYLALLMCERIRMAFQWIEDITLLPLNARLAKRIAALAASHGVKTAQGIRIDLRLPQEELGYMLGTSRQTINKTLKEWESKNWIQLRYGLITLLDVEAIKKQANSDMEFINL